MRRPAATAALRLRSIARKDFRQSGRPTLATRSRSSCRVIGSSTPMVRLGVMAAASTASGNYFNSKQSMLTDSAKRQLEEQGYLILPGFLSSEQVAGFNARIEEIFALEGDRAGREFKQEPGTRRLA